MPENTPDRQSALLRAQSYRARKEAQELEQLAKKRERDRAREASEARRRIRDTETALRQSHSPARTRVSQADVPTWTLLDIIPVARAVRDRGGSREPVPPHIVAEDLGEGLASTPFRTKTAASAAYGLTDGGAQADGISLTALGQRVLGGGTDAQVAATEALLRPRLLGTILSSFNGASWPSDSTLRRRLLAGGYAEQAVDRAVQVIRRNVMELGLVAGTPATGGEPLLGLQAAQSATSASSSAEPQALAVNAAELAVSGSYAHATEIAPPRDHGMGLPAAAFEGRERVFISAASRGTLLGELSEILTFGGYWPVTSPDQTADATSPEVMGLMRSCSAALIDLAAHPVRRDEPDEQSLVRVGAALALCGDKAVFLCPGGLAMPPAYEHLRHLRYPGGSLDHESTMALLRAFNNIRGN